MKTNRFLVMGVVLSVVMSATSLALQIKGKNGVFQRFNKNLALSEMDWRIVKMDVQFLQDMIPKDHGLGVTSFHRLSKDYSTITLRREVYEKDLPSDFEQRKALLTYAAIIPLATTNGFFPGINDSNIELEYFDTMKSVGATTRSGQIPKEGGLVAVFKNGQLTMR